MHTPTAILPAAPKLASLLLALLLLIAPACTQTHSSNAQPQAADIRQYISQSWDLLTRSPLNCAALVDPKVPPGQSILYLPADEPLTDAQRSAAATCDVKILTLPQPIDPGRIQRSGLLYLPHPYVVPGGRFNEMYGWDSYFIVEGLIEDDRPTLAKGMTENFFYELDHYGAIFNANRTYYLTRSQPPFLTSMVLAVARPMPTTSRKTWIAQGYAAAQKDWQYWNRPEMKAGDTGLSRYFDTGVGPVPEMHDDPAYYQGVLEKLYAMGDAGRPFIKEVTPPATPLIHAAGGAFTLTDDFYRGDRAMRASGYDVSFRFGPYGGATHHFAPVCLNALLYREESDLADMAQELNKPEEAAAWRARAESRKNAINHLLWDDQRGLFFDYDFLTQKRSDYSYATTFFPLWAGLATPDQARRVATHLEDFFKPGGIAMSTRQTGVQWDLPFGWAPVQLLTVEGLRRYGYTRQAEFISERWLTMIVENYRREGTLREKYDVVTRSAEVNVQIGYSANVIGFGWTNAVFLKLLHSLPPESQTRILNSGS